MAKDQDIPLEDTEWVDVLIDPDIEGLTKMFVENTSTLVIRYRLLVSTAEGGKLKPGEILAEENDIQIRNPTHQDEDVKVYCRRI